MLTFKTEDLFLNPNDLELQYRRRNDEEKTGVSYGQRKLLLTVLQFITNYWDPAQIPNPCILYIGSSPGNNIEIIAELFPEVEFHLYDPNPFKIKKSEKVHLYQQYFTDEDAHFWKNKNSGNVYFISDIRTADYTKAKNLDDNERQIMKDMENQMKWYNIIKPVHAHLKFRLPYTGGNRPAVLSYLDGTLYKQPWAPGTSTETRLVPNGDGNGITKNWDCMKYQSQLFHHNVIIRETFLYDNLCLDSPELLNDYDSRCEVEILTNYLNKRNAFSTENVKKLSRMITKRLSPTLTMEFLRKNPRYIKDVNFRSREKKETRDNSSEIHHRNKKESGLAKQLGL